MKHLLIITAAIILAFAACKKEEDPVIIPNNTVKYHAYSSLKPFRISYIDFDNKLKDTIIKDTVWNYQFNQDTGKFVYLYNSSGDLNITQTISIHYRGVLLGEKTGIGTDTSSCPMIALNFYLK